jgi:uncharacterized cupin superfamily protein
MAIHVEKNPTPDTLQKLGVRAWPIWEKEVSSFPWTYDETEVCYILEGEVHVQPMDGMKPTGIAVSFAAGDLVTFPAGLSCTWTIIQPVRKHYRFG